VGAFPRPAQARVLWARVESAALAALRQRVVAATARLGRPEEDRPFRAHATLARLQEPADARAWVERHAAAAWQGTLADVHLYHSTLGASGPAYRVVQAWPLA